EVDHHGLGVDSVSVPTVSAARRSWTALRSIGTDGGATTPSRTRSPLTAMMLTRMLPAITISSPRRRERTNICSSLHRYDERGSEKGQDSWHRPNTNRLVPAHARKTHSPAKEALEILPQMHQVFLDHFPVLLGLGQDNGTLDDGNKVFRQALGAPPRSGCPLHLRLLKVVL